jgi:hypothetical protein
MTIEVNNPLAWYMHLYLNNYSTSKLSKIESKEEIKIYFIFTRSLKL